MEILKKYKSFRDWYLLGIAADLDTNLVELHLMVDDKKDHARVIFSDDRRRRGPVRHFVGEAYHER
ncbi:hypothetical protein V4C53_45260 [Paraburkholderia azotifigens]|uniref:hypothetical protein n=1 Tax=Paraburkholderia azotifigens TaxID=2057004 RepID=UPI00317D1BE0